ncbi:MAG TPA: DUF1835 domain-containing protein [Candidatus Baltobacteraceae bacterium]|nr:DUF1835 domain-containing protein [Candidatus Baltobacteraceae bacterium]
MSANSLHITNGDSVIYTWKKAGLLGTHVAWKDILHEGPVPAGMPLEELSRLRADYLAHRGFGSGIKLHRDFEKRDAIIRRAREFDEIVLWFEHDLYDQLHLLQILWVLREQGMGSGFVQLLQTDQYLGTLNADDLLALYPKRRFVTTAIADAAARAWSAFTSEDPAALADAAKATYTGLPFLRDALQRLCEEYPDSESGLSRTQKHVLEACAQGARRKEDIFRRAQAREEASFLGDTTAYFIIDDLCAQPAPLLSLLEPEYDLTVLGRRVLAGDADWLDHQPLDRWVGGVHLNGERRWRWNDSQQTLVERVGNSHETAL